MATTKRSKGGRATASRAKTTARGRATSSAKAAPKRKTATKAKPVAKAKSAVKAKPFGKAKPVAKPKPVGMPKATRATKPIAKPKAAAQVARGSKDSPEIVALKAKFQRERNGFEKRLTEAVREIGILRHHEMRAIHFERQVGERDATIGRLQMQLSELERRPAEPVYVHEIQQSLALGAPALHHGAPGADARADLDGTGVDLDAGAADLDEFEDDRLPDDGDLVSDDD